jgi:hypothetical protein
VEEAIPRAVDRWVGSVLHRQGGTACFAEAGIRRRCAKARVRLARVRRFGKCPRFRSSRSGLPSRTACRFVAGHTGGFVVHPVAEALADEFAAFAWLLRCEAFTRFGFDPDGVFGDERLRRVG